MWLRYRLRQKNKPNQAAPRSKPLEMHARCIPMRRSIRTWQAGSLQAAREVRLDDENRDTTELSAVRMRDCVLATFRCFVSPSTMEPYPDVASGRRIDKRDAYTQVQIDGADGDSRETEIPGVTYGKIVGFDRYIKFIQTFFFSMTLQASWEELYIGFAPGLYNGGPTPLVYCMLLAWLGCIAIFASLTEMASFDPNVGAQYRWCARYAPPLFTPRFWGLLQGWITVFGWIFTCAGPPFINGTLIQGLIILTREDFVPQRWHGTLLSWAILALPIACNKWCRKILAPLETLLGITHLRFFPITVIVLAVTAKHSSKKYVEATTTTGISGWTGPDVQLCIGLLTLAFTLGAFDGVLHMGNEIRDAPREIPRAMIYSVISNGAMAFLMVITLLYTIGNPEAALSTPTGYPIIQIFCSRTGWKAAPVVLTLMQIWAGIGSLFGVLASVSRLTCKPSIGQTRYLSTSCHRCRGFSQRQWSAVLRVFWSCQRYVQYLFPRDLTGNLRST